MSQSDLSIPLRRYFSSNIENNDLTLLSYVRCSSHQHQNTNLAPKPQGNIHEAYLPLTHPPTPVLKTFQHVSSGKRERQGKRRMCGGGALCNMQLTPENDWLTS